MTMIQRTIEGMPVIEIDGVLGVSNSPALDTCIATLIENGHASVVLDMSRVGHVDSTGLSMLVASRAMLQQAGGDLRLAGVNPRVWRVLEVTRLTGVFRVYLSVDEAVSRAGQRARVAA